MAKPKKFNFQACAERMVRQMGAAQDASGDLMLQTLAGPMKVIPFEDWLACRFIDVERAKKLSPPGSLNPFSGKWNWHYTKPTEADLAHLYEQLCGVLSVDGEIERQYGLNCSSSRPESERYALLSYRYRDGSNNKATCNLLLSDAPQYSLKKVLLAMPTHDGMRRFIPGSVGLADLQDSFGAESRWDPEGDHPWHELVDIKAVTGRAGLEVDGSFEDFEEAVFRAAFVDGWDEAYKPSFYPEMARRQKDYERSMRERV